MDKDEFYKGMAVSERLRVAGLTEEFGKAIRAGDAAKANDLLSKVNITEEYAQPIINFAMQNLKR